MKFKILNTYSHNKKKKFREKRRSFEKHSEGKTRLHTK